MSDSGRILAKLFAERGSNAKMISGDCVGQINPYIEWVKWLSYEPEFEKEMMDYLEAKDASEITLEEEAKRHLIIRNRLFAPLFKKYGSDNCSKEEYMQVYDFMCTESIEELMLSKLTSEELKYAKKRIVKLSKLPEEELSEKVHKGQKEEVYNNLSMVDSYILHIISKINFSRSDEKLTSKIDAESDINNASHQKGLHYASK